MRNSLARRISLHRPRPDEIEALERQRKTAIDADDAEGAAQADQDLEAAQRRSRRVAYIDPVDVRYNRFERVPKPNTQAVMFCLMDVSGSMTEAMKDLAKRFFLLLHVFLERRYKHGQRRLHPPHLQRAGSGRGDVLPLAARPAAPSSRPRSKRCCAWCSERYSPDNWNIYAAQASDGDNYTEDSDRCSQLLGEEILPITQYFAYIEVGAEATLRHGFPSPATDLWRTYAQVAEQPREFRHAPCRRPDADLPGIPRAFRQAPRRGLTW